MSFTNPAVRAYINKNKAEKPELEETKENIIPLDEIIKEENKIEYIDYPKFAYLTSAPSLFLITPEKLGQMAVNYDNASTKSIDKSI